MDDYSIRLKGSVKLPGLFHNLETPYDFFHYFLDVTLLTLITYDSNLYSIQSTPITAMTILERSSNALGKLPKEEEKDDRLYKIRPIIDHLIQRFRKIQVLQWDFHAKKQHWIFLKKPATSLVFIS